MSAVSIADKAQWLADQGLQRLLSALAEDGEEARVAGGAVRNTLLALPVADIDIATTCLPEETERRARARGFKTVATGKDHGTITVIDDGRPYEVTTLRADVESDGRHAKVVFGRDWKRDAERRDFTINALYATAEGDVIDLVGGLADLDSRTLRFIGEAEARIREDYLRILRFFRFFAWYGVGRPDADGIKASARLKDGIERLSAERVWAELKKLLGAPDPSRALLWMRQAGVLSKALPESDKWGIDSIHGLVSTERDLGWKPDPLLRLAAIVPPDSQRMTALGERLRLSTGERTRLEGWASAIPVLATMGDLALRKAAYRGDIEGLRDRLRLALASARAKARVDDQALHDAAAFSKMLKFLDGWKRPDFPIGGNDLIELGASPGKQLGYQLRTLEDQWIEADFQLDRDALLKRAAKLVEEAT